MFTINPYQILGISSNATADECKKAYRKLVLKHHPDRGGDEKSFILLNEAYSTLEKCNFVYQHDAKPSRLIHEDLFNFVAV